MDSQGDGKAGAVVCKAFVVPVHLKAEAVNVLLSVPSGLHPSPAVLSDTSLSGLNSKGWVLKAVCVRWKMNPSRSGRGPPAPAGKALVPVAEGC